MKKHLHISLFVILCALFMMFSLSAFAIEEEFIGYSKASDLPSYMPSVGGDCELFAETKTIEQHLFENMLNFTAKIDVSNYGITKANIDELNDHFGNALLMNHELYYVDFYYTYWYNGKGLITRVEPNYLVTDKTEIANTIAQIDAAYEKILLLVDDSMTDLEKIITVYNEVILMTCYDYSLEKTTPKDLLFEGITVCQGYAGVLYELCVRMGIPCGLVRSTPMNHVWNAFYIDGEWYHADATWDDPKPKNSSRMTYTYFLKSNDYYINSANHYDFTPLESNSTKYDNYFWNEATSKLVMVADHVYFIKGKKLRGTICVLNTETGEISELYKSSSIWYANENNSSYWSSSHSGLEYYEGRLYFNTSVAIMSCRIDGTDARVEYTVPVTNAESVYGCYKKDGKLSYSIGPKSSVNADQTQYFFDFPESTSDKPFYVVNTFKQDGKNYLSCINDTDEIINIFAIFKNGNKFDHAEIIPVTIKEGKIELPSSDTEYEFVIMNDAFSPLAQKMSIKP